MFEDKNVRIAATAALSLLSLFLLATTVSEFKSMRFIGSSPSQPSLITVSGKGEVVAVPNIATFSFSVTEESLLVKTAQDEAAQKTNDIVAYLKKNGVAEK